MSLQDQASKITSDYNCDIVILQSNGIIERCGDCCIYRALLYPHLYEQDNLPN